MLLFVGLGNPTPNSENNRHNIGFKIIDAINQKLGGSTKYINQREEEFLSSALKEHNYRQEFINALDSYVESNKFKYTQLTNKVYKFKFLFRYFILPFPYNIDVLLFMPRITSDPIFEEILIISFELKFNFFLLIKNFNMEDAFIDPPPIPDFCGIFLLILIKNF